MLILVQLKTGVTGINNSIEPCKLSNFRIVVPGCESVVGEEMVRIRSSDGTIDVDSGSHEANQEHAKETRQGECVPRRSEGYADAGGVCGDGEEDGRS